MPEMRIPDDNHPITISPEPRRLRVMAGEKLIAETTQGLVLREASYRAVYYIPRGDADPAVLGESNHHTYCPYKGQASYFSVPSLGARYDNSVWYYPEPYDAVAVIAGHLAFYADRFDVVVVD